MIGRRNADRRVHRGNPDPRPDRDPELPSGDRSPNRRTSPRVVEDTIKAWKLAYWDGIGGFRGIGVHRAYLPLDVAACDVGESHPAPARGCSCGFYANMGQKPVDIKGALSAGMVLLEVELYGRVMVHQNGYRAEKQRVLAVYAHKGYLGSNGCSIEVEGQATVLYTGTSSYSQGNMARAVTRCNQSASWADNYGNSLCTRHVLTHHHKFFPLKVATPDLGGVEWHWV